jgi:hypothetical protein
MRRIARTDANQREVVEALRAAGVSVLCLHQLGRGVPDLLVGTGGEHAGNLLLELKDGAKPLSARRLTPDEERFMASWRGPRAIVCSVAEAFEALIAHGMWRCGRPVPVATYRHEAVAGESKGDAPTGAGGG